MDTNLFVTVGSLIIKAKVIVNEQHLLQISGCNGSVPGVYFPPTTTFTLITTDNKCPVGSTLSTPNIIGIEGEYKQQKDIKPTKYTLSYKDQNKTLTWFGGSADAGLLRRTGNTVGSVTKQNLVKLTGYYSAYPLAKYLTSKSKVILPKQYERGENNIATNSVISGKCLHVYKKCSANGKKAELWLPIVDRGPDDGGSYKIDVSPAAYKNLQQQEGLSGSDKLTGYGVQLDYCH